MQATPDARRPRIWRGLAHIMQAVVHPDELHPADGAHLAVASTALDQGCGRNSSIAARALAVRHMRLAMAAASEAAIRSVAAEAVPSAVAAAIRSVAAEVTPLAVVAAVIANVANRLGPSSQLERGV